MALTAESRDNKRHTTLAFFGGSDYSLRVLLAILNAGETKLAYFIADQIETKTSAWLDLQQQVPNIEQLLFSAQDTDADWLIKGLSRDHVDIGLSVNFMRCLSPDLLAAFPLGCLNLHPSLLPYNRGTWPELWSIIEGTPSGVTLHYMDHTLDTGDIIEQTEVEVHSYDTGESLCARIEEAGLSLLGKHWPQISKVKVQASPQGPRTKLRKDKERIDLECLDLSEVGTLKHHLDILRALTLRPFISGGWYIDKKSGLKVQVMVTFDVCTAGQEFDPGGDAK